MRKDRRALALKVFDFFDRIEIYGAGKWDSFSSIVSIVHKSFVRITVFLHFSLLAKNEDSKISFLPIHLFVQLFQVHYSAFTSVFTFLRNNLH